MRGSRIAERGASERGAGLAAAAHKVDLLLTGYQGWLEPSPRAHRHARETLAHKHLYHTRPLVMHMRCPLRTTVSAERYNARKRNKKTCVPQPLLHTRTHALCVRGLPP